MLASIQAGLDRAEDLPVGRTTLEAGFYSQLDNEIFRAGLHAEVLSHFRKDWSLFGRVSAGVAVANQHTYLDALVMFGIRGTF